MFKDIEDFVNGNFFIDIHDNSSRDSFNNVNILHDFIKFYIAANSKHVFYFLLLLYLIIIYASLFILFYMVRHIGVLQDDVKIKMVCSGREGSQISL